MTLEQLAEEKRLVLDALRSPESPLHAYVFSVDTEALGSMSFKCTLPWYRNIFRTHTPASAHISVPLMTFSRQLDTSAALFAKRVEPIVSIVDVKERALAAAVHESAKNDMNRKADVCALLASAAIGLGMNTLLKHKAMRARGIVGALVLCCGVSVGAAAGIVALASVATAKRALRERTVDPRHLASYAATVQGVARHHVLVAPQWNPATMVTQSLAYVGWGVARRVYENAM